MIRLIRMILILLIFCHPLFSQINNGIAYRIRYAASLPATCSPTTGDIYFKTSATIGPYYCSAANTWSAMSGGGSVSAPAGEILFGNADGTGVTSSPYLKRGGATQPLSIVRTGNTSAVTASSAPLINTVNFLTADNAAYAGQVIAGLVVDAGAQGTFAVQTIRSILGYGEYYGSANVTGNMTIFESDVDLEGTGTIVDFAHIRVKTGFIDPAQPITNLYGLRIEDQAGGSSTYAIRTGLGAVSISTASTAGILNTSGHVFMSGLTTSAGIQTSYICQASTGELIADSGLCLASSARFKHDISDIQTPALDIVQHLHPVTFVYNSGDTSTHYGFIAEEVEKVDPRLVSYDSSGQPRTVQYDMYTALLTKAVQELSERVRLLESRVKTK